MDLINGIIAWLEQNWGMTLFGTVSLGSVITMIIFLAKQWISNKVQGTKYEEMWKGAQETVKTVIEMNKELRATNDKQARRNLFLEQTQNVMFDTLIKMSLASKMDAEDKQAIILNIERLKSVAPEDIIEEAKVKVTETVAQVGLEIQKDPEKVANDILNGAQSLLEKYSKGE